MTAEIPYSIHPLSKPPRATRRLQGPRAAAFSCPPEPCPTFATLASPLSILPHLSFPALPRQPNLPHSTETLARSPKEELLFGGRPYFSIYTGPDWSSTGWQSLGMYLRFCCARRDSPPERNRTHTRFFFSGVDIFGLPDLRRGLGNGTLRASASQILGAVLLLRAEGRRERVPGPESWLSHFEIDVPRASPIIKVLGGHLFLSTQWSRVRSSRTLLPPRAVGVPMRPSSFVTQKPRHKSRRGLHHLSLGSIANVKVVCKMRIPSQFMLPRSFVIRSLGTVFRLRGTRQNKGQLICRSTGRRHHPIRFNPSNSHAQIYVHVSSLPLSFHQEHRLAFNL